PYREYCHDEIPALIQNGIRETIPDETPTEFSKIIEQCWSSIPSNRPYAEDVVKMIQELDDEKKCIVETFDSYDSDDSKDLKGEWDSKLKVIEHISPPTKEISTTLNDFIIYDIAEGYFYG